MLNINKPKRKPLFKTFQCLKNYSPDIICEALINNTNVLNSIINTDNVDMQVEILIKVFNECLDSCAPIVTRKITHPSAPWLTNDIKEAMQIRNQIQNELKMNRYDALCERYKGEKEEAGTLEAEVEGNGNETPEVKCTDFTVSMGSSTSLTVPCGSSRLMKNCSKKLVWEFLSSVFVGTCRFTAKENMLQTSTILEILKPSITFCKHFITSTFTCLILQVIEKVQSLFMNQYEAKFYPLLLLVFHPKSYKFFSFF
ncbi:hypothetical protein SK128_012030 [Halocaridina rubra]|uniref:Uncharacterized protein n=1 Tax=Halocaridina rubra TaxID=373956 RepID=A0AAN8WMT5_HALRR